jgi:hypothetical protein
MFRKGVSLSKVFTICGYTLKIILKFERELCNLKLNGKILPVN